MLERLTALTGVTVVVVLTYPDFAGSLPEVAVTFTWNVPDEVWVTLSVNTMLAPAESGTEVILVTAVEARSGFETVMV